LIFQSGWVSKVDAAAEGRKLDGEGAQEKEVTSSPAATCFSKQLSLSRLQPDLGRRRAAPIYTPHNNDNNMMCVRVLCAILSPIGFFTCTHALAFDQARRKSLCQPHLLKAFTQ
jgi:hypothetical protein